MDVSPSCGDPGPRPGDGQTMQFNPICAAFAIMFHKLLTAPIGGTVRCRVRRRPPDGAFTYPARVAGGLSPART
jgi:hypothetical protein